MSGPAGDDITERLTEQSGGIRGRGVRIRRSIELLRQSDDPALRRLADDVLAGRRTVRSVLQEPAFTAALSTLMPRFFRQFDDLEATAWDGLVAEGRDQRRRDLRGDPAV